MLLREFVTERRTEIVSRARLRISERIAPLPTEEELGVGVEIFLDELLIALSPSASEAPSMARQSRGAPPALRPGFTIAQVVYDFGDICQAITEIIGEHGEHLEAREFRILNQCLDDAIASAVTDFARRRDVLNRGREGERLKAFAEKLRVLLSTAVLAYEMVQRGSVGVSGSTGILIGRSLTGLRRTIDSTLALARLESSSAVCTRVELSAVLEELQIPATVEARGRGVRLAMPVGTSAVYVEADREMLLAALASLLDAAVHGTPRGGLVTLEVAPEGPRVQLDVLASGTYAPTSIEDEGLAMARAAIGACGGSLSTTLVDQGRMHRVVLTAAALAS